MAKMRQTKSAGLGDPDDATHRDAPPAQQHAEVPLALLREIRDEAQGLAAQLKGSG